MKQPVTVAQELFLMVGSLILIAFVAAFFAIEFTNSTPGTQAWTAPSLTLEIKDTVLIPEILSWTWAANGFTPAQYQYRYLAPWATQWSDYLSFSPSAQNRWDFASDNLPGGEYRLQIRARNAKHWIESNVARTRVLTDPGKGGPRLIFDARSPVTIPETLFWTWQAENLFPREYEYRWRRQDGPWSEYRQFRPNGANSKTWPSDGMPEGYYEFQIRLSGGQDWVESAVKGVYIYPPLAGTVNGQLLFSGPGYALAGQELSWTWEKVNFQANTFQLRHKAPDPTEWSAYEDLPGQNGLASFDSAGLAPGSHEFQLRALVGESWIESNIVKTHIAPDGQSAASLTLSAASPVYQPDDMVWI